jgi:hypothetical protein
MNFTRRTSDGTDRLGRRRTGIPSILVRIQAVVPTAVEFLGRANGVLPGHRIGNEQHLRRRGCSAISATSSIISWSTCNRPAVSDDDHRGDAHFCQAILADLSGSRWCPLRRRECLTDGERQQLVHCRRSVDVGGDEQRLIALDRR